MNDDDWYLIKPEDYDQLKADFEKCQQDLDAALKWIDNLYDNRPPEYWRDMPDRLWKAIEEWRMNQEGRNEILP